MVENCKELPGAHRSWVEHILLFVVPRQIIELGDPTRRSCDACESLGARFKKLIKHLTCRRAVASGPKKRDLPGRAGSSTRQQALASWRQCFSVGYIEQAFKRLVVEQEIRHGEQNERYLQREDHLLRTQGLTGVKKEHAEKRSSMTPSIRKALEESLEEAGTAD